MKHFTLLSIMLSLLVGMGFSTESYAQANTSAQIQIGQKSYHVAVRLDRTNREAYVVFYGPATRRGTNVSVKVYQSANGVLVQQDIVTTNGGGKYEKLSLDALDPGEYTIIVSGEKYSLSQPFIWF